MAGIVGVTKLNKNKCRPLSKAININAAAHTVEKETYVKQSRANDKAVSEAVEDIFEGEV